jgi:hypothetical protein
VIKSDERRFVCALIHITTLVGVENDPLLVHYKNYQEEAPNARHQRRAQMIEDEKFADCASAACRSSYAKSRLNWRHYSTPGSTGSRSSVVLIFSLC